MTLESRIVFALVSVSSTACVPSPLEFNLPIQSLTISPTQNVQPNESVVLELGHVVLHKDGKPKLRVVSSADRAWPFSLQETGSPTRWVVRPNEPWPIDTTMRIELMAADGRAEHEARFATGRPSVPDALRLSVHSPASGQHLPPNLKFLAMSVEPADTMVERFVLMSSNHRVIAPVVKVLSPGLFLMEIPQDSLDCLGLCPRTQYEIKVDGIDSDKQSMAEIQVGALIDDMPPRLKRSKIDVWGDFMRILVTADEWIVASARIKPAGGEVIPLKVRGDSTREVILESVEPLLPNTIYTADLVLMDLCGQSSTVSFADFKTIGELKVSISELVPSPLHDWSDSSPNHQAYDIFPGMGAVTEIDEWIELINESEQPIVIGTAGLYIRTLDTTPTETWLSYAPAIRIGDGLTGNTWAPGRALVFRPEGSLNQTDFVIEVYSGRRLLDRLVIGDQLDSEHSGGRPPDLEHEALAKDAYGSWRWCVPSPGDARPVAECL